MNDSSPPSESNVANSISNELVETTVDLQIDYLELGLDSVFDDNILKDIPFVKTIYSLAKIGYNLKERFFVKKMLLFLKEFHNRTIDPMKLQEFKEEFQNDRKYRNKVTEMIMVYNDSFLDAEKSKIFAKLFSAYIYGHYDWNHFRHLSTCLNDLKYEGFKFLAKLSNANFEVSEVRDDNAPKRDFDSEAILSSGGIAYTAGVWSSGFYITQSGKDLYKFGMAD